MAKTKHKQLAALAPSSVKESGIPATTTDGEHNNKMDPVAEQWQSRRRSRKPTLREQHSPETEVRQQRVIIWIPPAIPMSRSEVSTNAVAEVLTNGTTTTPSRKRNHNSDNKSLLAASNERSRINKSFSKVIFKVGNWREEKIVEEAGPSVGPTAAVAETDKSSQRPPRTKTGSNTLSPTKRTKTQRVVFNIPSLCEEADGAIAFGNSREPPAEMQGIIAEDGDVHGGSLTESPMTLSKGKTPRRKAGSLKGLLAANPLFQSPLGQREEPVTNNRGADSVTGGNETARAEKKKGPTTSVRKQENTLDRRRERAPGVPSRHLKRLAKESPRKESSKEPAQMAADASARDFQLVKMTETVPRISGSPGTILPTSVPPSSVPADPQAGSFDATQKEKPPQHVSHVQGSLEKDASGKMAPTVDTSILQHSLAPKAVPSLVKEALPSGGMVEAAVQSQTRLLRSGRTIGLQPEGTIPSETIPSEMSSHTPSLRPNSSGKAAVAGTAATASLLAAAAQISNAEVTVRGDAGKKNTKLQAPPDAPRLLAYGFKATSSGNHLTCGTESNNNNTVTPPGLQTRSVAAAGLVRDKETWCKGNQLPAQHAYLAKVNGQQVSEKSIRSATCGQDNKEVGFPSTKQNSYEGIAGMRDGINHFLPPKLSNRPLQMSGVSNSELARSKQVNRAVVVKAKLEEGGGLTDWLVERGLGVFVGLFEERQVDEGALLQLTMEDLKEMGVHAVGPRRKLIWAIENL